MRGTIYKRCGCPVRRTSGGEILKGADGASIKDHRSGCKQKWAYVFDAGRDTTGKRKQDTLGGFRTKREAEVALASALERFNKGLHVQTGPLLLRDYFQSWLGGKAALRPSTVQAYESHLRLYLIPALGHLKLTDLRHVHVERMFRALRERAEVMSPATLRRVHATLNSALNSAVRQQLITHNHATHVELPSARRRPHTVWTAEEWRHFSQFAEGHRLAPAYRVIALTGMRRGEAAGLRWEDVDLDGRVLHVRQQRVQLQGRVVVGPPKSDTGRRDVPIDGETADALRQLRARQVGEALQSGRGRESLHYVFVREDGSPVLPEALYRTFTRLAQKAGLRSIRLHDLRHAHASYALAAGVSMKVVQERLGHSSITLTADTYTSVLDSVAASAADQIAAFMDGPTGRSSAR